ncbi:hypothetical protein DAPPUDRAFT_266853 [Daphnia pulex]|uniref:Uncharacterized protein n=1 Tax=Daphnia pulex TaxID=6669 RepID=E9HVN2_DAPPU|nr:hypothetical protein DAPPUDRAFT_266853 [Daphnia pulex]|eukprot:EFX64199.1 hypothetical protein DAPPUDRAFT_266853 [Daphnia pulex]
MLVANLPYERSIPDGDFRVDVVLETSRRYARNHFFTTDKQLHLLRKAKRWYGDGTFFICPTPFYLVFGIHAFICHGHLDKQIVRRQEPFLMMKTQQDLVSINTIATTTH